MACCHFQFYICISHVAAFDSCFISIWRKKAEVEDEIEDKIEDEFEDDKLKLKADANFPVLR